MSIPLALLLGTIGVVIALVGWIIYINVVDYRNENTIGRDFDTYAEREKGGGRFRAED